MKKVILTPNPYRDKNFQTVRNAVHVLGDCGIEARICLPFEIDRAYDLPKDLRFSRLDRELPTADAVICFGGDGTILHMAKAATRKGIPILGNTRKVETGEQSVLKEEAKRKAVEALNSLPKHLREVLILKEYGNLNYKEIGKVLGISEGNVKVRVFRAREKLEKFIGDGDSVFLS